MKFKIISNGKGQVPNNLALAKKLVAKDLGVCFQTVVNWIEGDIGCLRSFDDYNWQHHYDKDGWNFILKVVIK